MAPNRSKSKARAPSGKRRQRRKAVGEGAFSERFNFDIEKVFGTDEELPFEAPLRITPEGNVVAHFSVSTLFGTFTFVYNYTELPKEFTAGVKRTINDFFIKFRKREKEALKAGHRPQNPSLQQVLDSYSEGAYQLFIQRLPSEMHAVPYRLVLEILFALISDMDKRGGIFLGDKSATRKLWDGLAEIYRKSLKGSWLDLKPGRSATTSKAERAEMLAYYNSILPDCQSAKSIYKQDRKGPWRSQVKETHKCLDRDDIENIIRLKPSEVAHLITGKHFKRINGKNFHGEAELRRQLGIARKEAAAKTKK